MSRILITGGAGFIGSHLTDHFVESGHTVAVADKFSYAGKGRNLADVLPRIDLLIGNLASGDLAKRCAEWGPEVVIHAAGDTHVDMAIADPFRFQVNNVLGTCSLLEALRRMDKPPRKVIVYSTDEVFGPTPGGVAYREDQGFRPSNAYSASKVGVEGLASSFWVTHGLPTVVVRPCNTYGRRQHPEKVVPKFTGQILRGEPVTLYNDGEGSRDWLHTSDHARAIAAIIEHGEPGTSYNLARGDERTDRQVYEMIVGVLRDTGFSGEPATTYVPGRPGHDRRYIMDGSRLRSLGWTPAVDWADGMRDAVLWNVQNAHWWDGDAVRLGQPAVLDMAGVF